MSLGALTGFSFIIRCGRIELAFQRVSGITREIETLTYQEGGLNDQVHIFQKPAATERVLHLERGVCQGTNHPFYLVGERITDELRLEVLNSKGEQAKAYTFTGLVVKRWEAGELDATQSVLLIDKFELAYEAMEVS